MPRQQVKKTYFSFVGGLNTEGGFLTYPPNTWKEGENLIPNVNGSIHLRTAFNYEPGFQLSSNLSSQDEKNFHAFSVHQWDAVDGDGSVNWLVVRRGRFLYVYENIDAAVSSTEKDATYKIDLNTYKVATYTDVIGKEPIHVANVDGKIIVSSKAINPLLIANSAAGLVVTPITVKYRDFDGLNDGFSGNSVDTEPASLSAEHGYNIKNQGWLDAHVTTYFASQAKYPSNAQQWFVGKNATDDFDPALLKKHDFGKSHAPKGRFILDAFNRDRTAVSGVAGITAEVENERTEIVAFFAGRAWYAGINSDKLAQWIFFSKVGNTADALGNCYQEADPTSEISSDLVASDGGVVVIKGMGSVKDMVALSNALIVLADNGVWAIKGSSLEGGFAADAYEVSQLSSVGVIGRHTVVGLEDQVFFWSIDGIWVVATDRSSGVLSVNNLTHQTIATFYQSIKPLTKSTAKGFYHDNDKKLYWLYNNAPNPDGATDQHKKDRILVFDIRLKAFYVHTIGSLSVDSPLVVSGFAAKNISTANVEHNVLNAALDQVQDSGNADVVVNLASTLTPPLFPQGAVKLLTLVPTGLSWTVTFSSFDDGSVQASRLKDWYSKDGVGVGYVGFLLTGHDLGANQGGDRKLQTNYIDVLMERTETGIDAAGTPINEASVKLTTRWHFADSAVSNKWSTTAELYRHRRVFIPPSLPATTFDDGYPVIIAKHKMRGRGNAFQMKFESTIGKDFKLIGWSIPVMSNVD